MRAHLTTLLVEKGENSRGCATRRFWSCLLEAVLARGNPNYMTVGSHCPGTTFSKGQNILEVKGVVISLCPSLHVPPA